ncbi:hypothetical protein QOT17_006867 [Balamuthia mandrillaris]
MSHRKKVVKKRHHDQPMDKPNKHKIPGDYVSSPSEDDDEEAKWLAPENRKPKDIRKPKDEDTGEEKGTVARKLERRVAKLEQEHTVLLQKYKQLREVVTLSEKQVQVEVNRYADLFRAQAAYTQEREPYSQQEESKHEFHALCKRVIPPCYWVRDVIYPLWTTWCRRRKNHKQRREPRVLSDFLAFLTEQHAEGNNDPRHWQRESTHFVDLALDNKELHYLRCVSLMGSPLPANGKHFTKYWRSRLFAYWQELFDEGKIAVIMNESKTKTNKPKKKTNPEDDEGDENDEQEKKRKKGSGSTTAQVKKRKTAGCRDIPLASDSFDDDSLASLTLSLPSPKSCRSKGNEVQPKGSATARSRSASKEKSKHPAPSVSLPRKDRGKDRQPITPSPPVPQPSKDEGMADDEETEEEEEDLNTPSSPPSPPPKPPSQPHSKPTTSTSTTTNRPKVASGASGASGAMRDTPTATTKLATKRSKVASQTDTSTTTTTATATTAARTPDPPKADAPIRRSERMRQAKSAW